MQGKSVYDSPPDKCNAIENAGDKDKKSESDNHKENDNSFAFEVKARLLLQSGGTIPETLCDLDLEQSDIEIGHHVLSDPNICGSTSTNHEYRILEHSLPRPANTSVGTLKHSEKNNVISVIEGNSTVQSPNTTILSLKKGQRLKDGMILMLTGQVDRRKHLLLGAQVFYSYVYFRDYQTWIKAEHRHEYNLCACKSYER